MAEIYFIGDLHLGHRKILGFSPERAEWCGSDRIEDHDEWLISLIKKKVKKNDLLYVLGDVSFDMDGLFRLSTIDCRKVLALGNHDKFDMDIYLGVFEEVFGIKNKYKMWLSHAPIHPDELRSKPNIHGHTHSHKILDYRYVNVSVENVGGRPVPLHQIRAYFETEDLYPFTTLSKADLLRRAKRCPTS